MKHTFRHIYYPLETIEVEGDLPWKALYEMKPGSWEDYELLNPPNMDTEPEVRVSHLEKHDNFKGNAVDAFWYQFCSSIPIDSTQYQRIILAIENALKPTT